jgi:serine/threonine protein kinase
MLVEAGTIFGSDFRVVRQLGAGGMGEVYVAEQLSTGKERALKVMSTALGHDPKLRAMFDQEARVGGRIESEHVVEVVAAGVEPQTDRPWLAMELLRGEGLGSHVTRHGPLREGELFAVFEQICHAMGAAHRAGVIHRDLKPDNIFLAESRRARVPFTVKILDFGIAKLLAQAGASVHASNSRAVGTPLWMSPEQSMAGLIDARADVWSLGLIAFYVVTGKYYWQAGETLSATLGEMLDELLVRPLPSAVARANEWGVGNLLPQGFDAWFRRCVNRDLEQRFRDADEVWAGLQKVLGATVGGQYSLGTTSPRKPLASSAPSLLPPPGSQPPRAVSVAPLPGVPVKEGARRLGPALGAVAAVALLAALGFYGWQRFGPHPVRVTHIRTHKFKYLVTASTGGGVPRGLGTVGTDATTIGDGERFTFVPRSDPSRPGAFLIRTAFGDYLQAPAEGGLHGNESVPLRTDALTAGADEGFHVRFLGWDHTTPDCLSLPAPWDRGCPVVALQTQDGLHYVTTVAGAGTMKDTSPIRAIAVARPREWETFFIGDFATE